MEKSRKKLYDIIDNLLKEKVVLAFSGGVDSALLLKIASSLRQDENDVVAMFFKAPSSTEEDLRNAKKLADDMGVKLYIKEVDIFVSDHIINNSKDRCYHCKSHLFKQAIDLKDELGYGYVIDGTNTDDHNVYRPGLMALRDLGVVSPLNEAGFSKEMVRNLAAELNISVAKRPSAPCLLTRFPYGTKITPEKLERLENAESFVRGLGFEKFRVRDHANIARIELEVSDFNKFIEKRVDVIDEFKKLGFSYVTLDLEGFRSGSMDEGLSEEEKKEVGLIMDKKTLIAKIKSGEITEEAALKILDDKGYEDIGDVAKIDFARKDRRGFPEAIYCASKDDESLVKIFKAFYERRESVIGTRASKRQFEVVKEVISDVEYSELGQIISLDYSKEADKIGEIAIVSAGTSDLPVSLEAEITARFLGAKVKTYRDVGVAGVHRLLDKIEEIKKANVIIAIAGMEAALATVLAGLVDKPIIAVPTSVGYGANLGGITALLSMINSCAEGVSVVNIDNGYGAAYQACQINKLIAKGSK